VDDLITNTDDVFTLMSNKRFHLITEAYKSPNACRSILIPRNSTSSLMFDCDTEDFAITAGNDRKIRYWDLTSLRQKSY